MRKASKHLVTWLKTREWPVILEVRTQIQQGRGAIRMVVTKRLESYEKVQVSYILF